MRIEVAVSGILADSMRSGVKFCVDSWSREVKGTILEPFREKLPGNVPALAYANAEHTLYLMLICPIQKCVSYFDPPQYRTSTAQNHPNKSTPWGHK